MLFLYIICERIKTRLFSPLTMGSRYLHTSLIIFHDYTLGVHQRSGKNNMRPMRVNVLAKQAT